MKNEVNNKRLFSIQSVNNTALHWTGSCWSTRTVNRFWITLGRSCVIVVVESIMMMMVLFNQHTQTRTNHVNTKLSTIQNVWFTATARATTTGERQPRRWRRQQNGQHKFVCDAGTKAPEPEGTETEQNGTFLGPLFLLGLIWCVMKGDRLGPIQATIQPTMPIRGHVRNKSTNQESICTIKFDSLLFILNTPASSTTTNIHRQKYREINDEFSGELTASGPRTRSKSN